MDQRLRNYFLQIMPISDEEIEAIDSTMHEVHCKKGDILLRPGQVSLDVYFVLEGVVRQYYLIDGEEKTSDFFVDEQWVVSLNNINPDLPSTYYLECCVDCKLLVGNSSKGEELYRKYPNLETVSRKLMEKVFMAQQEKIQLFTINTPPLRYQNLLKMRPDLFQRIPQYQIASYIGVTPESLSRIRKRIAKQGQ